MLNLGKVNPGSTIYIPFDSFDGGTGASITMSGLATSDIEIYKDGGTTQRASDAGYTLLDTDGIDFDTITGIHGFSVDLADNTTSGFYAAGSDYFIVVSSITIDAQTVNFVAARFRIGYEASIIDTTIATLSTQTSFTLTAGPAEDDALNGCIVLIHDVASAVQKGFAVVSDYTGATKTVTLTAGTTFTAAATDNISFFPPVNAAYGGAVAYSTTRGLSGTALPAVAADGAGGLPISDAGGLDLDAKIGALTYGTANRVNVQVYGMESGTITAAAIANAAIDAATFAADVDAEILSYIVDDATRIDASALNTASAATGSNGSGLTEAGGTGDHLTAVPWNASWDEEVQSEVQDAIEVNHLDHLLAVAAAGTEAANSSYWSALVSKSATPAYSSYVNTTDSLEAQRDNVGTAGAGLTAADDAVITLIGVAGAGLTDLGGMSTTMKAQVEAEVDDALGGGTGTALTAIPWNASWDTEVQSEVEDALVSHHMVLVKTTIATLASQTSFTLTAGSADNDAYNDCVIVIEDSATAAQKAVGVVDDYTGATKTVTLRTDPAVFTMATTDVVTILACRSLKPTVMNRTLDVSSTGEGGVDWANVGTPGSTVNLSATTVNLVNTITTYTGNTLQTGDSYARLGAPAGASVSADIAAIEAQTDDIGAAGAGLTAITGATLSSAYDFAKGNVAMTESYNADGAAATPIQALYVIMQMLTEMTISSTTMTIKKLDGSTTALTLTLNDATSPTSVTRAS